MEAFYFALLFYFQQWLILHYIILLSLSNVDKCIFYLVFDCRANWGVNSGSLSWSFIFLLYLQVLVKGLGLTVQSLVSFACQNKYSGDCSFFSMCLYCFGRMNLWCSLRVLLLHFPHPRCVQSRPRSWSYSAHGLRSLWISVHSMEHHSSGKNRQLWLEIRERWRRKSGHCITWIEGQMLVSDAVFWP